MIRTQIRELDIYLSGLHISVPSMLPLMSIQPGTQAATGFSYPEDLPFSTHIPFAAGRFDLLSIRAEYGQYVFGKIFGIDDTAIPFPLHANLLWSSWIYGGYFAMSSLNAGPRKDSNPNSLGGWPFVLWGIRGQCGVSFTDRSLIYAIVRIKDLSGTDKIPEIHGTVTRGSKDFSKWFIPKLIDGMYVVDDNLQHLPCVNRILKQRGIE